MSVWEALWTGVTRDWQEFPTLARATQIIMRLFWAALLGGLLGFERELTGKAAGMRTHMLVALGAALFAVVPEEFGGTTADTSRVVQGLAAGVGFLGAGSIIKLPEDRRIKGLTTAAGIWLTSAIGVAVGVGRLGIAL
ncbi:MAG: MgtC/SapB family protein, partial [Gemmataceae bacterium]|nr:MgtC/SapB family protein [Gemmataceae bacterium]